MNLSPIKDYLCTKCGSISIAVQGGDYFCCDQCGDYMNIDDRRQCFQCGEMQLLSQFENWKTNTCIRCETLWAEQQKVVKNAWTDRMRNKPFNRFESLAPANLEFYSYTSTLRPKNTLSLDFLARTQKEAEDDND